jgi:hypothetical protein
MTLDKINFLLTQPLTSNNKTPRAGMLKLFTTITYYEEWQKSKFVIVSHFHPSIIFSGRLISVPMRGSAVGWPQICL